MIFNSISKQLNSNKHQYEDYRKAQYQPSGYSHYSPYQRYTIPTNEQYQQPQRGSTISQMNQKIVDNLEYLKSRDYYRGKDLKSSRISNSSNRSLYSNKSKHSTHSASKISANTHSRINPIRTKIDQHYFPQTSFSKYGYKDLQQNKSSSYIQPRSPMQQSESYQYKQFMRKPITIQHYNQKFGKIAQKISKQPFQHTQHSSSYRSKTDGKDINSHNVQIQRLRQPIFYTPGQRQYSASFGKGFGKQSAVTQQLPLQKQSYAKSAMAAEKQNTAILSPLQIQKNKNNKGMIIAIILVGLGLILFALQVLK